MIWSERRNFCFVHIPKTGGSAITFAYLQAIAFGDVVLGGPPFAEELSKLYARTLKLDKHSSAARITEVVGKERFQRCHSCAVLRDPMARLGSYYRWMQGKESGLSKGQEKLKRCGTFKEFVSEASKVFVPQVNYVLDANGAVIVRELLMYERLATEWSRIANGIGVPDQLPLANKSKSSAVAFDDSDSKIVREFYRRDFELIAKVESQSPRLKA
jgi:hypothetical protein